MESPKIGYAVCFAAGPTAIATIAIAIKLGRVKTGIFGVLHVEGCEHAGDFLLSVCYCLKICLVIHLCLCLRWCFTIMVVLYLVIL